MVCSANSFGEDQVIQASYAQVIFKDSVSRETERKRYLTELHAFVREAARVYLKKKKPSTSETELQAWTRGIVATAAHESYWSHYRQTTDGRLKMMRGDFGHGHGLMQIDDRAHYPVVQKGIAWNLISHVTYAMDIYSSAWERAASQTCVKNATDYWEARIRSAWSAYNGGPSRLCRWTDPGNAWAQNDKNFLNILRGKRWEPYLASNFQTKIPISCLMENKENCSNTSPSPHPGVPVEGMLYRLEDKICLSKNSRFECVNTERDRACLQTFSSVQLDSIIDWTSNQSQNFALNLNDRHLLCPQFAPLIPVGTALRTTANINLRETPGGGLLSYVPNGTSLIVRDFEVRGTESDRYYRVRYGNTEGYIYAGNRLTSASWAIPVSSSLAMPQNISRLGERIQIQNSVGINLRSSPAGDFILTIPSKTILKVEEVTARSNENKLYYKVSYQGRTGYIYTGYLLPQESISAWTSVIRP